MVGTVIMMKMNEDGLTPEQRVDKIFSKMDKNKDDQITLDEFKEAISNRNFFKKENFFHLFAFSQSSWCTRDNIIKKILLRFPL